MSRDPYTDRTALTTEAYADPARLTARYSLYEHRWPPLDLPAIGAGLLHDAAGPVVDVGCGPGRYVAALRDDRPHRMVVAADLSPGMATVAGAPALVADATALPFATGRAGGVLAMHMLYHVPDPPAAVAELARVRAPGGTVLIATNAAGDKDGLYALCRSATGGLLGGRPDVAHRFALDEAESVARQHFPTVRRLEFPGELRIVDPEPVVAFVASTAAWYRGADGPAVLERVRAAVAGVIAADGAFRFATIPGILVCR
jgi:SAM-dependent methyltransferase